MPSFTFSKSNLYKQLFINNEYIKSTNSKTLTLLHPADKSLVADDVALAGEKDVDAAVDAAVKAFPAWKRIPASKRRDILNRFASLLEEHAAGIDVSRMLRNKMAQFQPPNDVR